ncbi:MAG: glycosyltransferase [Gemmatimonadaceae bacterium]
MHSLLAAVLSDVAGDSLSAALAWSLPWWLAIGATGWRWRGSPSLDEIQSAAPSDAPLLSVIVPARNESLHIAGCVRSILETNYPAMEVIVVDDHSTDDTGALASASAARDPRFRLTTPAPLPDEWLGKQWACEHGASISKGAFLLFTDADVRHGSELHARMMGMMERDACDLLTIAGHQETLTFWERVVQPFVFSILAQRYGGPGAVNRSPRASEKIANGQCLLFRREAYEAFGGHSAVRDRAAEDLAFAQGMFARGLRTQLALGTEQLSTRMYASLGEIVSGWGKNVYAAGRDALPGGRRATMLAPLLVPLPALWSLLPVVVLALGAVRPASPALVAFGSSATLAQLLWFAIIDRQFRIPLRYAITFPLGALVYLYIALFAVLRGRNIEWKGRRYLAR